MKGRWCFSLISSLFYISLQSFEGFMTLQNMKKQIKYHCNFYPLTTTEFRGDYRQYWPQRPRTWETLTFNQSLQAGLRFIFSILIFQTYELSLSIYLPRSGWVQGTRIWNLPQTKIIWWSLKITSLTVKLWYHWH